MTGSVLARDRRAALVRPAWGERGAGPLVAWLCGGLALAIAVALYTRFSWDGRLWRDESIYVYEAQRMLHGVPPYASIFDPKTPLAGMLYALAVAAGRGAGIGDVHAVRVLSLGLSLAAVVGIYVLVLALWRSPVAALVAAVAFAAFRGFAEAALSGPDAKTPGVLAGIVCLVLAVRGRWFWAGFAGALAALVWQPFGAYVLVASAGAWLCGDRAQGRRRVLAPIAGALVPLVAVLAYFLAAGALPKLIEAAVVFPLTGVERGGPQGPGVLLTRILDVVRAENGLRGAVVLWSGVVLLAVLVVQRRSLRDPFTVVVVPAFVLLGGYSLHDFQGGGDVFPLFPFGAIGVGGAVALLLAGLRRLGAGPAGLALAGVLVVGLTALAWRDFTAPFPTRRMLVLERTHAAELQRLAGPRGRLWALGDPTPLVLLGRTNPSRFIYLGSGVAHWHARHLPHRMHSWRRAIRAYHPAVIPVDGWIGGEADRMLGWLGRHYASTGVGRWTVFLSPGAARRARRAGFAVLHRLPRLHG